MNRRKWLKSFRAIVFGALMCAGFCASAETFYWTGAANDGNKTGTVGNWSLSSGGPAAGTAPGQGDTVVFENKEALTLTKSGNLNYLAYEFRGANVALPKGSNLRQYGWGGGGITATGTGTYTFGFPLELNANQFTGDDKTFTVDVREGATVVVTEDSSGTTKIYSPANFIKRGAGTFMCTEFLPSDVNSRGDLTFEAGTLTSERSYDRNDYFGVFTVKGAATKQFTQDAKDVRIVRYVEEPQASQMMTFYCGAGNRVVELQGAYDVPRFSADITSLYGNSNTLQWNPGAAKTLTMVDRVWNSNYGKILVSKGTMKFADGAGVKKIGGFTVKSGANVTIAVSASWDFSGADIVLESGATLTVEGGDHYFKPKSVTYDGTKVSDGVYSAGEPAWLKGTGHLWIGSATRPAVTLCWTGAAGEASPKLSTAANWRCEDGSPVAALQSDDSRVISNETDIVVAEDLVITAPATFTKQGAGTLQCQKYLPSDVATRGKFVFEAGKLTSPRPDPRWGYFGEFVVTGTAKKQFDQATDGAMNLSIVKYVETEDASESLTFYNFQGTGYVVELCGAYDVPRFSANLTSSWGDNTLKWNPGANKTITMVDRIWDTANGKFLVSSGTMRFASGAGVKTLKDFTVAAGAAVEIAADAGSFVGTVNLKLEDGAKLILDGVEGKVRAVTISGVTYGGTAVPDGTYSSDDFDWFEGDAILVVGSGSPAETKTAAWTGNGDGTTITDPRNWGSASATELPDFASGALVATFPANGTVTIPSGVLWKLKGIVVDPSGAKVDRLTVQGAGEIWVGTQGLVSLGAGAVSIAVKTGILSSEPWTFGQTTGGGSLTIETTGEIFTLGSAVWTVNSALSSYGASGNGPFLDLMGSNPNLGDSSFKMPVRVFADGALGGPDSTATIDCNIRSALALELTSCHLQNKRVFLKGVAGFGYLQSIKSTGPVVLDGELYFEAYNDYYWSSSSTTDNEGLTVRGGWRTAESTGLQRIGQPSGSGYKVFVENGFEANKFWLSQAGCLDVSGEIDVPSGFFIGDGAFLRLNEGSSFKQGVDSKSVAGVGFTGTEGTGTLDLQGTDATVQILAGEGRGVVTSEEPATLTLKTDTEFVTSQSRGWEAAPTFSTKIGAGTTTFDKEVDIKDAQQTDYACFAGAVNLVKTGLLPHWLGGVSTSTGAVTVAEGVLTFKQGAQWRSAAAVEVSGTGTLAVEGDGVLSPKTPISVTGDESGRISIPAGKTLKCASLTVNGVTRSSGMISSGVVSGGGVLQVGRMGLFMVVR